MSIREASEMLRVSLRTVQRLVAVHSLSSLMAQGRREVPIGALVNDLDFPRRHQVDHFV